jgi:molybdate/tungstate transport system ATP-binding protein
MISATVRKRLGRFQLDAGLEGSGLVYVLGANGAGKTTLLRALAGLIRMDEGYVKLGGVDVTSSPPEKRGIVYVSPESCIPNLTVEEHLVWGAAARGAAVDGAEVKRLREALGIDFKGKVRELSMGMRVRVSLATALLSSPRAILVDEAFSSLHDRVKFVRTFSSIARQAGVDVVAAAHDSEEAEEISDHVYVLQDGRSVRKF